MGDRIAEAEVFPIARAQRRDRLEPDKRDPPASSACVAELSQSRVELGLALGPDHEHRVHPSGGERWRGLPVVGLVVRGVAELGDGTGGHALPERLRKAGQQLGRQVQRHQPRIGQGQVRAPGRCRLPLGRGGQRVDH